MKKLATVAAFLFVTACCGGQDVIVPDKIEAKTGRLASVVIKSSAKDTAWVVVPSGDIDLFREYDPSTNVIRLRFLPYKDGRYSLVIAGASGDKVTQVVCVIVATGGQPVPEPMPPPGPGPDPKPLPPDKLGFASLARTQVLMLPLDVRHFAAPLADNFEAVASKLAATATMTVDQANAELKSRHQATLGDKRAAWLPWFAAWKELADRLNGTGDLATREHYVQAYTETAAGLRAAK